MSRVERVSRSRSAFLARGQGGRSQSPLSMDDWTNFFNFAGVAYPIIQTTLGSVDRERVAMSSIGAYEASSSVFALVLARMQVFSQIRFQWTRFSGSLPGDLWGTQELSILERPWPNGTTADLLARMEVDVSLAGNSYTFRSRPDRLSRLRPEFVTIILGSELDANHPADAPDCEVAGYLYTPPSGDQRLYFPYEVAHYAPIPNPYYHFLGMSWITPCIRELQGDVLMTEHKVRFMENAATPNLAIKFDPAIDIDRVKAFKALMEKDHTGVFNAYRTLYLGGGADPVVVGKDFQQLDFAVSQGKGESRLAAAAGVPPSWVGFSEGLQGSSLNAGNFNSARRRFSDGTMIHLWTNASASLECLLSKPDPQSSLWFDQRIPFMRADAQDAAAIKAQEAATINGLIMQGFDADSAVKAVVNNDWSLLKHTGLASVQLQAPKNGQAPKTPPSPAGTDDESTGDEE